MNKEQANANGESLEQVKGRINATLLDSHEEVMPGNLETKFKEDLGKTLDAAESIKLLNSLREQSKQPIIPFNPTAQQ